MAKAAYRQYAVRLTGETGLLLHHDNLQWAGIMSKWQKDPGNKAKSVPGDDRTPAWRWIGCIYQDLGKLVIPADNLMTVLREGGKRCPTGKGQTTFKAQTQSGIVVDQAAWPIEVNGKTIAVDDVEALLEEEDFEKHLEATKRLGFELFVKRAKIGMSKNVRVRPLFRTWSIAGSVTVFDEMITTDVLKDILANAGAYAGIGDWRPSSPKSPGPFGKFTSEVKAI